MRPTRNLFRHKHRYMALRTFRPKMILKLICKACPKLLRSPIIATILAHSRRTWQLNSIQVCKTNKISPVKRRKIKIIRRIRLSTLTYKLSNRCRSKQGERRTLQHSMTNPLRINLNSSLIRCRFALNGLQLKIN